MHPHAEIEGVHGVGFGFAAAVAIPAVARKMANVDVPRMRSASNRFILDALIMLDLILYSSIYSIRSKGKRTFVIRWQMNQRTVSISRCSWARNSV